eukprot:6804050-Karenia_brevis.AAC.1
MSNPSITISNLSTCHRAWDRSLATIIELSTQPYTHFNSADQYENRIDRLFWSVPPWASRLMALTRPNFPPPRNFHRKGLSDHSPVAFVCGPRTPSPPEYRPVPSFVTKSPEYRAAVQ